MSFKHWWSQNISHIQLCPTGKGICTICITTQHRLRGLKVENVAGELDQLREHINMANFGREIYRTTQEEARAEMQKMHTR